MHFTDLPGRKLTLFTHINGKNYIIKDTLQAPDWNILNDIKEVAGYICASASTFDSVRKQKVNAWFALDIPISIGPDRWYGLPGAILEVDLNDGALVISTDKIEFCKLTTQMDTPKKSKGKVIAQRDIMRSLENFMHAVFTSGKAIIIWLLIKNFKQCHENRICYISSPKDGYFFIKEPVHTY